MQQKIKSCGNADLITWFLIHVQAPFGQIEDQGKSPMFGRLLKTIRSEFWWHILRIKIDNVPVFKNTDKVNWWVSGAVSTELTGLQCEQIHEHQHIWRVITENYLKDEIHIHTN